MQKTTMLTAAIAVAVMMSGFAMMPGQAVAANCDHDYDIGSGEPLLPRSLASSEIEVGRVIVDDSGDVTVRVSLESAFDDLEFGVFYLDGMNCTSAAADNLSTCGTAESLTTGLVPPDQQDCTLDAAPANSSIHYFFVFENVGSSPLDYKAWKL